MRQGTLLEGGQCCLACAGHGGGMWESVCWGANSFSARARNRQRTVGCAKSSRSRLSFAIILARSPLTRPGSLVAHSAWHARDGAPVPKLSRPVQKHNVFCLAKLSRDRLELRHSTVLQAVAFPRYPPRAIYQGYPPKVELLWYVSALFRACRMNDRVTPRYLAYL